MTREWKPGDVALATVRGVPEVPVFRVHRAWVHLPPGNEDRKYPATYSALYDNANEVNDVRPLVVIDPEDPEQVERLTGALVYSGAGKNDDNHWREVQAALRSLLAPPKPYSEHAGTDAPWPITAECHGHKWVAWTDAPCGIGCGGGIPVRCSTCGLRKCDREMCSLERHHSGLHSDLDEVPS